MEQWKQITRKPREDYFAIDCIMTKMLHFCLCRVFIYSWLECMSSYIEACKLSVLAQHLPIVVETNMRNTLFLTLWVTDGQKLGDD